MKKKLLFVMPSLEAGGGEKSLVTLLNAIDFDCYEVDLVLLKEAGIFLKLLPAEVKIIPLEGNYKTFTQGLLAAFFDLLLRGNFRLAYARLAFSLKNKFIQNKAVAEQQSWKNIVKAIPELTGHYDVAIGFLEKSSVYFVADRVKAKKKIGFIHNDYSQLGLDAQFDLPYFEKLGAIATVSQECQSVLQHIFPSQKEKIKIVPNIVSPALIEKMAGAAISVDRSKPVLLSIGRLHPQKGFDIAIEAAARLRQKGVDFTWQVIGEGAERPALTQLIAARNLRGRFVLLGLKENPYPYLKAADIVVQSSRYEGKSIAIDEAKILCKPIIVTDFTTAKDQITHGHNGIIAQMDPESLASAIENLLLDKELQKELSLHLQQEKSAVEPGNETAAFYQLLADGC